MTSALRRSAAGVATVLVLSACATRYKSSLIPTCRTNTETLVLMAQAVPTAQQVPCIASLPAGWVFRSIDIRNGRASFALDSDRAGDRAVQVALRASCDTAGATEIVTDEQEAGTSRFERVESLVSEYRGVRFYRFDGGCVTYRFDFDRRGLALVNEVSRALGFVSRGEVARQANVESL